MWFNNPIYIEIKKRSSCLDILKGYENIERNICSRKINRRTRGHEIKLVKNQCRLDIRNYYHRGNQLMEQKINKLRKC